MLESGCAVAAEEDNAVRAAVLKTHEAFDLSLASIKNTSALTAKTSTFLTDFVTNVIADHEKDENLMQLLIQHATDERLARENSETIAKHAEDLVRIEQETQTIEDEARERIATLRKQAAAARNAIKLLTTQPSGTKRAAPVDNTRVRVTKQKQVESPSAQVATPSSSPRGPTHAEQMDAAEAEGRRLAQTGAGFQSLPVQTRRSAAKKVSAKKVSPKKGKKVLEDSDDEVPEEEEKSSESEGEFHQV